MIDITLACLIMGFGIGIDVALATFFHQRLLRSKKSIVFWLVGVTLTHTLFPMIGYLLAYTGVNTLPVISPLIGILAALCISYFIYQELYAIDNKVGDVNEKKSPHLMVTLGLILAVSWDALWSGPAKSAQVISWPEFWVWASFFIVGLVVFLFAMLSCLLAKKFNRMMMNEGFSQWLQLSIISYFGLLAFFRYTLASNVSQWWLLIMASIFIVSLMFIKTLTPTRTKSEQLSQA